MRQASFILAGAVAASFALVGCDVDKTAEGDVTVPKYEVSKTQEGNVDLPKYDVDAPKVDVSKTEAEVAVPKVSMEKETITVPKVEITAADEKDDDKKTVQR